MKKIILLVLVLLFAGICFAQENNAPTNTINNKDISLADLLSQTWSLPNSTVVATVGDVSITKGELMAELWKTGANKVLDTLINQKILEQAFAKEKIVIKPEEYDAEVDALLKQYGISTLEDFIEKANISLSDFKKEIKIQLSIKKYVDKHFVLDKEKLNAYMKPSHILIKFDSSIENEVEREAACKQKIDEIYAKVKAGEDFAALAKEFSEDGSKNAGGSLGWVDGNVNYVPEFKAAMLNLKAGEYTEPVKTQFGYHIIKMEARGDSVTGEELDKLIAKEKDAESTKLINTWFSSVRNDFPVVNNLVPVKTAAPTPENK